jgi:hypothetical protein
MYSEMIGDVISILKSLTIIALSVVVYFQRKTITELEEERYNR